MNKDSIILTPIDVSAINPIYDQDGHITEWGLTVTYNNRDVVPPRVKGARVNNVKISGKKTLAEYHFPESVMKQGLERAWLFRDALLKQIDRQQESR